MKEQNTDSCQEKAFEDQVFGWLEQIRVENKLTTLAMKSSAQIGVPAYSLILNDGNRDHFEWADNLREIPERTKLLHRRAAQAKADKIAKMKAEIAELERAAS